ncbi:MAG: hypothetical protein EA391_03180 [Balneolaceae bacterium]|nr:MAG: hypothetical protein EA391_03180 [Balneolaceae bacterium]
MWGDLYLLIASILSLLIIIKRYPNRVRDIKVSSILALVVYVASELITNFENEFAILLKPILFITALSLVFVILLMLIRRLKPVVFQYPYPIVFLPLLLPFSFLFVMDTIIVEQIILASIQAVVIVVLFLLTAGYSHYLDKRGGMYLGLLLLITSFILYWMVGEVVNIEQWIWKLTLSFGMILTIYSLSGLLINKLDETVEDEEYL